MNLPSRVRVLEAKAQTVLAVPCAPNPLRTPADVVEVLSAEVEAVRRNPRIDPVDRVRAVGMLAAVALRAMEAAEDQCRLEAIERVLKLRRESQRSKDGKR